MNDSDNQKPPFTYQVQATLRDFYVSSREPQDNYVPRGGYFEFTGKAIHDGKDKPKVFTNNGQYSTSYKGKSVTSYGEYSSGKTFRSVLGASNANLEFKLQDKNITVFSSIDYMTAGKLTKDDEPDVLKEESCAGTYLYADILLNVKNITKQMISLCYWIDESMTLKLSDEYDLMDLDIDFLELKGVSGSSEKKNKIITRSLKTYSYPFQIEPGAELEVDTGNLSRITRQIFVKMEDLNGTVLLDGKKQPDHGRVSAELRYRLNIQVEELCTDPDSAPFSSSFFNSAG